MSSKTQDINFVFGDISQSLLSRKSNLFSLFFSYVLLCFSDVHTRTRTKHGSIDGRWLRIMAWGRPRPLVEEQRPDAEATQRLRRSPNHIRGRINNHGPLVRNWSNLNVLSVVPGGRLIKIDKCRTTLRITSRPKVYGPSPETSWSSSSGRGCLCMH